MQGSPLPLLPISKLSRSGVFLPVGDGSGRYAAVWLIRFGGFEGMVAFDAANDTLHCTLQVGDTPRKLRFDVETKVWRGGKRRYWMCPRCSGAREDLILLEEGLCRDCYRSSSSPYPKRHREALLYEAEDLIRHKLFSVRAIRESAAASSPAAIEPPPTLSTDLQRAHSNRTQTAIDRGRGMAMSDLFNLYRDMPIEDVMSLPEAAGYGRPGKIGFVDQFRQLDINVVYRALGKGSSDVKAVCLSWSSDPVPSQTGLFVEMRFDEPIVVLAHQPYDTAEPRWQRLTVVTHSTGRLRWLCPVLRKNVDTLYGRNDLFASRQAQRLITRKQRAAGRRGKDDHIASAD